MDKDIIINPDILIEIYKQAMAGTEPILPSQLTPENRLAGTQITAEIWNDTINGLRRICANLIENLKNHTEGTERVIREFIEEVNAYLTDALGKFNFDFTEWLKRIQYFDVEEIGDGVYDYRLHFTFGTLEDPHLYDFTTENLIAYNQIWVTQDADGNPTPEPVQPKYDNEGKPVLDPDTGRPVYEPCWVIKIDPSSNSPETFVTVELLEKLLGASELPPDTLPVFSDLALIKKLLDVNALLEALNTKGTVARRLDALEAANTRQDATLTEHGRNIDDLLQKFIDLGDVSKLPGAIETLGDFQNMKDALDFDHIWADYVGDKVNKTVWRRLSDLELKSGELDKSQSKQDTRLDRLDGGKGPDYGTGGIVNNLQEQVDSLKAQLKSLNERLTVSAWQALYLNPRDWTAKSYFEYCKVNGHVNIRFWLQSARTISHPVSWNAAWYIGRLPEEYRPDEHWNIQMACTLYTAYDNEVGQAHVELISLDEDVYYIAADGVTVPAQPDRNTDGSIYLRTVSFGDNGYWPIGAGYSFGGQATYVIRDKEDLK